MNRFERILSGIAPGIAVKRAEARARMAALDGVTMAYDGATTGRRSQGWRVVSTDANAENLPALSRMRDVARDMVRNNPHAANGKRVLRQNIVGPGIIPAVQARSKTRRKLIEQLLKDHFDTTDCDARGQTNLYGLQDQVIGAVAEGGEALVRWRPRKRSDGLALPFQLEVLEGDYLDMSVDGTLRNGNIAIQGVEFDLLGRRVAYWIYKNHPGSYSGLGSTASSRVPADRVAHVYRIDRPGQVRGITWFSAVILKMRDLADYADAQLVRQKVAACFAAFITGTEGVAQDAQGATIDTSGSGFAVESLEPGMIQRLRDGEEVTFGTPPSVGDYEAYKRAELRDVAVGLGVTYESLAGDYSNVNFSSGRMGWIEFHRTVTGAQNHMLIPQLCAPVGRWFMEAAATVAGDLADARLTWTAPRREMINPLEEYKALAFAVRNGFMSMPDALLSLGLDPQDHVDQIKAFMKMVDDAEVILDSDPRHRTGQGNAITDTTTPPPADPAGTDSKGNANA